MSATAKRLAARFPETARRLAIVRALFSLRCAELDLVQHFINRIETHRNPHA